MLTTCPKCGVQWPADKPLPLTECPSCGVIFAKFHEAQDQQRKQQAEREAQAVRAAEKAEAKAAAKTKAQATKQTVVEPKKSATLAACPACGGTVAIGAKACPHCGRDDPAPMPKQSRKPIVLSAIALVAVVWLVVAKTPGGGSSSGASSYERCPDIVPASLWLPKGHDQSVLDDFTAKAYWLNTQRQCVLDGSYGEQTRKYYYSVRPLGEKQAKHVRFTRDELRR